MFFCAPKVLIEYFHCFFAVESRLRAAVLLLFVMSVWLLCSDSEIAQKTRSAAVIVPCLLRIVSLRPVLLFYLYFSFKHSVIFFYLISIAISLSVPLLCRPLCPVPSKDPIWLALSSFSARITLFVVRFLCVVEMHFSWQRSLFDWYIYCSSLVYSWGTYHLFQQIWLPAWLNLCENVCRGVFFRGQQWQSWFICQVKFKSSQV